MYQTARRIFLPRRFAFCAAYAPAPANQRFEHPLLHVTKTAHKGRSQPSPRSFTKSRSIPLAQKREARREGLRERLISVASGQIAARGLGQLKAREITAEAGCALGALYTVFGDLDELVMRVNTRTLGDMRAVLELVGSDAAPVSRLQAQARAYIAFAIDHQNRWTALFDFQLAPEKLLPDWMRLEQEALLALIAHPLASIFPGLEPDALSIRARIFFGAVQGAVQLALQDRYVAVPRAHLDAEVSALVLALCRGFTGTPVNTPAGALTQADA